MRSNYLHHLENALTEVACLPIAKDYRFFVSSTELEIHATQQQDRTCCDDYGTVASRPSYA